ncbi:MAG TPA: type II toxin-antitoxin system RelE/ParE family toxin [Nostocaceae cyanobacterium]|nr:type II toxin-antitoxin system RelE/ParE family toxin [Nostocaceae cyanobacterium]
MRQNDKPLIWLYGEIKTPPFSEAARVEAGVLLRRLQEGDNLGMPHSRPMPNIGKRCHELRVRDIDKNWRIIYRIDDDVILIVEIFNKTTGETPDQIIEISKKRLSRYDKDLEE